MIARCAIRVGLKKNLAGIIILTPLKRVFIRFFYLEVSPKTLNELKRNLVHTLLLRRSCSSRKNHESFGLVVLTPITCTLLIFSKTTKLNGLKLNLVHSFIIVGECLLRKVRKIQPYQGSSRLKHVFYRIIFNTSMFWWFPFPRLIFSITWD